MSYFGIGIYNAKNQLNVGSLWRTAAIFKAAFIFTVGRRIKRQASDTGNAAAGIPYYNYADFDNFLLSGLPFDCQLIGVELDKRAAPVESFKHPDRCVYLLGAEDNGLSEKARSKCRAIVELPFGNYNVANAGAIIMYDRYIKECKP